MKLKPKEVSADFINRDEDYTIIKIWGSPTLVYGDGDSKKKSYRGVAFKDTDMMREVAKNMVVIADMLDAIKKAQEVKIKDERRREEGVSEEDGVCG